LGFEAAASELLAEELFVAPGAREAVRGEVVSYRQFVMGRGYLRMFAACEAVMGIWVVGGRWRRAGQDG
jgi:hypothetical protein